MKNYFEKSFIFHRIFTVKKIFLKNLLTKQNLDKLRKTFFVSTEIDDDDDEFVSRLCGKRK